MDNARPEVWLPVHGYQGLYEVSNLGRVRSLLSNKILRPGVNRGYHHVALYLTPRASRTHYVHVTVLRAFCGPPPFPGAEACHNDGDRGHNHLTNLRWASRQDNVDDRARHGRTRFGTGCKRSKLTEQQVRDMRQAYRDGRSTYAMARDYELSTHTVWCAVTGKTWAHVEGAVNNAA